MPVNWYTAGKSLYHKKESRTFVNAEDVADVFVDLNDMSFKDERGSDSILATKEAVSKWLEENNRELFASANKYLSNCYFRAGAEIDIDYLMSISREKMEDIYA